MLPYFVSSTESVFLKTKSSTTHCTLLQMPSTSKLSRNIAIYTSKGGIIPPCPNIGCTRLVAVRHCDNPDIPSFHNQCNPCKTASAKGNSLSGITFVKKHSCDNIDSRLGWICPVDKDVYLIFPTDCYHLDHINGNHEDNRLENLQTLCVMCHARKGKESGDFNGSKSTSRKKKRITPDEPSSPK
jgi:hypothetical protein